MGETITMKAFDAKADGAFRQITNTLTNWERNQWAKAGYPGLRQKNAQPVAKMFPAAVRRITGFVTMIDAPLRIAP